MTLESTIFKKNAAGEQMIRDLMTTNAKHLMRKAIEDMDIPSGLDVPAKCHVRNISTFVKGR